MTSGKQLTLQQAFPRLFRVNAENPSSFSSFGIECGDGWYDLIYQLCFNIEEVLLVAGTTDKDWPIVRQIKEKFGGLRFYLDCSALEKSETPVAGMIEFRPVAGNKEIRKLIERAEARSLEVCEDCSAPGDLYRDGWWHVKCPHCESIYRQEREKFLKN